MDEALRDKIVGIIDKVAFFFFGVMVFFLPISGAAIEDEYRFTPL